MFYGAKPDLFEKARSLRKNMTASELLLWNKLRKNQLGVRFKSQHPIDVYIADFYCHAVKLVVEVDGESHKNKKEYDEDRTAELENFGITVIRFTNTEILNEMDRVLSVINDKILSLKSSSA
jgi:very-short-patch-repair endonuclease